MSYLAQALLLILLLLGNACSVPPNGGSQGHTAAIRPDLPSIGATSTPFAETPASASALLRFVGAEQDGTMHAGTDAATGLPTASVKIESSDSRLPVGLDADGLLVAIHTDEHGAAPYQAELRWTPWHGNCRYGLNLQLLDRPDGTIPSSAVITVNVVGIPESVPTVKARFIELYRDEFALNLSAPVFARFDASDRTPGEESRWVSAAYVADRLYEISILDTGTVSSRSYAVNSDDGGGFCRPSGTIRMLAVVVDYGNTGLEPSDAEAALRIGLSEARGRWIDYSRQIGLTGPILDLELTIYTYGAPPRPGRYLTTDEIRLASGLDPSDFDVLAEIDLDKDNTATSPYGGLGVSLGDGCRPSGVRRTNIAFNVINRSSLDTALSASIFEHELIHTMGWMHWWPNQYGDGLSWVLSSSGWEPYLMFGWTDVDGDGVIEIQDRTPYGLVQ